MAKNYDENKGISSFIIRLVGIASMIWCLYEKKIGNKFSDCLLWFSFTIFAFLLIEGLNRTSDMGLYLRRFIVFTLLSEIPYDLYTSGKFFDFDQQSVMFTLLLGFVSCLVCKYVKKKLENSIINILLIVILTILDLNIARIINSEFYEYGLLIIMVFYVSYYITYPHIFEFALIAYYGTRVSTETVLNITVKGIIYSIPIVAFALLATFFTWAYNEQRGANNLFLKLLFYLIYPISLLGIFALEKFGII